MKTSITIVYFLFIVATTIASNLPSNFKICNRSDPRYFECLREAITEAIVSMADGLKSFNVSPLDPWSMDIVKINGSESSLQQEYKDIQIRGITKGLVISNIKLNWKTLKLEMDSYSPLMNCLGDYKLHGKISILQVNGSGKCNITLKDIRMHHSMQFEEYVQEDNETYFRVTKYNIKLHPNNIIYEFDNIFNGDENLGKQINKFMNENSLLVFKEFQNPLEKVCNALLKDTCNNIFTRIPKKIIFP